jgi:hypothetical protein
VRRVSAETDGEQQDRRGPSLAALATRGCGRGLVLPQAVRIDRDIGDAGIAYFPLERPAQHRKASIFIRNRHRKESKNHQGARNDADHRYPWVSNGGAQNYLPPGLLPVVLQQMYVQTVIIVLLGVPMPSALSALALPQHPNEHGSQRPILLAVDQEFAAGEPGSAQRPGRRVPRPRENCAV